MQNQTSTPVKKAGGVVRTLRSFTALGRAKNTIEALPDSLSEQDICGAKKAAAAFWDAAKSEFRGLRYDKAATLCGMCAEAYCKITVQDPERGLVTPPDILLKIIEARQGQGDSLRETGSPKFGGIKRDALRKAVEAYELAISKSWEYLSEITYLAGTKDGEPDKEKLKDGHVEVIASLVRQADALEKLEDNGALESTYRRLGEAYTREAELEDNDVFRDGDLKRAREALEKADACKGKQKQKA